VKLLLDEMYPPAVAARLSQDGHDAVSVAADTDLSGLDDAAVCDYALSTRRAVVTENAADFLRILQQRVASGQPAPSLIIATNRSFPRRARLFIGRAVRALSSFCDSHPGDDPQAGAVHWLRPTH